MAPEAPGGVRGAARGARNHRHANPEPDPESASGSELLRFSPASGSGQDALRLAPALPLQDADSASRHGAGQKSDQRDEPAGALRMSAPVAPASQERATSINAPEGAAAREGTAARSALSLAGLQRVVSAARMSAAGGGMQVRMTLHPESLGEVMVQVRWERGVLTARLEAATPEARAALEGGLGSLRTALAEQGVPVERLQVGLQLGPDAQAQRHAPGDREPDPPRPRQEETTPSVATLTSTSEGTSLLDVRV
jgi:flagellar hook-length control protein FliK